MMAEARPDPDRVEIMSVNVPFGNYAPFRDLLDRVDWPPDYPMSLLYAQASSSSALLYAPLVRAFAGCRERCDSPIVRVLTCFSCLDRIQRTGVT